MTQEATWQEHGLDRQSLVADLNQWPELIGLSPMRLRVWKVLYAHLAEWVPATELQKALYGTSASTLPMEVMRTRRFLIGTRWLIQTQPRSAHNGGTHYRLVDAYD